MAQNRKIEISALNIKTHPHTPEKYIELFQDVFNLQQVVKMKSDYYGMIGSRTFINENKPLEGITGNINRFLQIDRNKPWFNTQENGEAKPEDIDEIYIPDYLKPNMANFRYAFYPVGHRLFFESYSDGEQIGPATMMNFFKRLFDHRKIQRKYGEVTIIVEPKKESLDDIFTIHTLKKLEMRVSRPNPDDPFESFEYKFYEKMESENANEVETSIKGHDLEPSEETQMLARVAASNGYVKGSGTDAEGKATKESTKEHPLKKRHFYNPKIESAREVFLYSSAAILEDIRKWLAGK